MNLSLSFVAAVAAAAIAPLGIFITDQVIADQAPAARRPIVQIVEQLERDGYQPFVEISFDGGYWEMEAYKQDVPLELAVDAYTGEILSAHRDDAASRPPHAARLLSKILYDLETVGYDTVCEVSFERRFWEIELFRAGDKYEILVDPKTGEICGERLDG